MIYKLLRKAFRLHNFKGIPSQVPQSTISTDLFDKIKSIPGWFNFTDCNTFSTILNYQNMMNLHGDVLEIGSYHGRSAACIYHFIKPNEKFHICDAFESDTLDSYRKKITVADLKSNLKPFNSNELLKDCLVVHNMLSDKLTFKIAQKFRFIHIDGGHNYSEVAGDLKLCAQHTCQYGVVVVDDYQNPNFPDVQKATDDFLREHASTFKVLIDQNRYFAQGRKLYLIRVS